MKTQHFLGAALLGLASSFSAVAQVVVPGAAPGAATTGGVAAPLGTTAPVPAQAGVAGATTGVLPSGGVAPAGASVPLGAGRPVAPGPAGSTLYGQPRRTATPAGAPLGTMTTTPSRTTSGSVPRRRTSTTKARP